MPAVRSHQQGGPSSAKEDYHPCLIWNLEKGPLEIMFSISLLLYSCQGRPTAVQHVMQGKVPE